ncbi:MAG: SusC/RagA family TonB-linked outer membrane protein, partial [Prevotellaceae bacterium]|nr:SusC/RagA family TonB-linked outer membrane protein [Candidatus Faecinaster equi]
INTDWNDILFRSVLNQEYNFSISGGNERSTFYTSIGYYDEQGTTKSVDNKRLNLTLKVDYKINKILKLGASVFANERKQNNYLTDFDGFTNPVYYSRLANPYQKVYDEEGNYIYDTNVQGKETTDYDFNIFEERRNTSNIRKDRSVLALFEGELKPIEDLKITSQFGLQYDGYNITKYAGENSYAMRKTYKNALYGGESFLPQGGMNKVTDYHSKGWTWKAMAEYNKAFNDIHELNVMLGTEVRHTQYNAITSTAYGYDAYTKTSQPVVFPKESLGESYPLYNETYMENAFVSWFATASYTYKYRYTLGGSVRFDGSDVFGVAKKYRYLPLYSVSGLWRINKEKFMRPIKWVNNLSIRASYGLQGNIDKNTSPYLIGIYKKQTILPDNIQRVIQAETAPNPSLKWEKTQNVNIGFDLAILNNAITLGLDYYYRRSSDLIGMKMLPLETGFSSTVINWAEMENRGFEVALATRNISTRKFRWTTNINLGFNSNKILHETVAENTTYPSREGYSVGAIFAYKTAGLDEGGYPFFVTKDGKKLSATDFFNLNNSGASQLTPEEQRAQFTYMGTSDPKVSGGFINTIEFGRFQFNMNWTFNLGMTVRVQPTYSCTNYDRGLNTNTDILSRWTSQNTNASLPVLMTSKDINKEGHSRIQEYARYTDYGGTSNPYNMLDIWVKDCDYFRLTSLRVGYKLPDIWMKNLKISSVSVSMEVRNLFVISSNYDNYLDPETMGNPYAQPLPKTVIFGINVNF